MAKTATRQTMDEEHCVIAVIDSEVAKFRMPQINAVTTSFLYVPSPMDSSALRAPPLVKGRSFQGFPPSSPPLAIRRRLGGLGGMPTRFTHSDVHWTSSLSRGFGSAETTVQNYEFILNRQKIIFPDSGFRRRGKGVVRGRHYSSARMSCTVQSMKRRVGPRTMSTSSWQKSNMSL